MKATRAWRGKNKGKIEILQSPSSAPSMGFISMVLIQFS
jgi:hypothetical protein